MHSHVNTKLLFDGLPEKRTWRGIAIIVGVVFSLTVVNMHAAPSGIFDQNVLKMQTLPTTRTEASEAPLPYEIHPVQPTSQAKIHIKSEGLPGIQTSWLVAFGRSGTTTMSDMVKSVSYFTTFGNSFHLIEPCHYGDVARVFHNCTEEIHSIIECDFAGVTHLLSLRHGEKRGSVAQAAKECKETLSRMLKTITVQNLEQEVFPILQDFLVVRVINLVRDARGIYQSQKLRGNWFYWVKDLQDQGFAGGDSTLNLNKFRTDLGGGNPDHLDYICGSQAHMTNTSHARILHVRFEDLLSTPGAAKNMLFFLGFPRNSVVESIAKAFLPGLRPGSTWEHINHYPSDPNPSVLLTSVNTIQLKVYVWTPCELDVLYGAACQFAFASWGYIGHIQIGASSANAVRISVNRSEARSVVSTAGPQTPYIQRAPQERLTVSMESLNGTVGMRKNLKEAVGLIQYDTWPLVSFWLTVLTPPIILALVYTCLHPKKPSKVVGLDTAALSGFRALLAFWVFAEHLGWHHVNGGSIFILLSGCVLSTSRRNALTGCLKSPITRVPQYLEFVWMRVWRLLPLCYFYLAVIETLKQRIAAITLKQRVAAINFWPSTFLNLMKMPIQAPALMIANTEALTEASKNLWFVGTILNLYLLYPILERIAIGGEDGVKPSFQRVSTVCAVCVFLKIATIVWLLKVFENFKGDNWSYYWKGYSMYESPWLRIPEFMLGILVPYLTVTEDILHDGTQRILAYVATLASDGIFVAMVLWGCLYPKTGVTMLLTDFNVEAPLLAFVLWGFCYGPTKSPIGKLLSWSCLIEIGTWSYGMFIWHPSILIYFNLEIFLGPSVSTFEFSELPRVAMVFGLCILISWSTFRIIEEPAQRTGRRLLMFFKRAPA